MSRSCHCGLLGCRLLGHIIACAVIVAMGPANAEETTVGATPESGNLLGQRGLLRTVAASTHPRGTVGIGADLQFFAANNLLAGTDGAGTDHSRLVNTYTLSWTPFRFLEAAFGLHVISDNSTGAAGDELQVTVGDPELSLKGSYELLPRLALGGLVDFRYLSATGFFESSGAGLDFSFAALASYQPLATLPLSMHINLGFVVDGSDSLFDNPSQLSSAQLFAAQVSSFNRVVARIGVDYATQYVGPFVEYVMEPFVGSGSPGFGDSPSRLSLGAHGWLGERKQLQLLAALDVGVTGVGHSSSPDLGNDKYAFVIPRWNLALRLSYRFDPLQQQKTPVSPKPIRPVVVEPKQAAIAGRVIDSKTLKPIWDARVTISDQDVSSLAVDPKDGSFRSFGVSVGRHTIVASAEGYVSGRTLLDVTDSGARTVIQLVPKRTSTPGTIRGTVTARGGALIDDATILIPDLDRTIAVSSDSTFSVSLKPGQYKVVVSAPGFRPQHKSIRVLEGSTVILNVELYK